MKIAGVLVVFARPAAPPRCARPLDGVSAAADPNDRLKLATARVAGSQGVKGQASNTSSVLHCGIIAT